MEIIFSGLFFNFQVRLISLNAVLLKILFLSRSVSFQVLRHMIVWNFTKPCLSHQFFFPPKQTLQSGLERNAIMHYKLAWKQIRLNKLHNTHSLLLGKWPVAISKNKQIFEHKFVLGKDYKWDRNISIQKNNLLCLINLDCNRNNLDLMEIY